MRVLIIAHIFPLNSADVTCSQVVVRQAMELESMGAEVHVVAPIPAVPWVLRWLRPRWRRFSAVPNRDMVKGLEVVHPRFVQFPRSLSLASDGRRVAEATRRAIARYWPGTSFDIVHAHFGLPDGAAACAIGRHLAIPVVVTFQSTDVDDTVERSRGCRRALDKVVEDATVVIAPSPSMALKLQRNLHCRATTIAYGTDVEPPDKQRESSCHISDGRFHVISVARLLRTKGIDIAIRAIDALSCAGTAVEYTIVGDGPSRRELEELVKSLSLNDVVTFVGWQDRSRVNALLRKATVFCLPSWQETLGVAYLEAMSAGLVVIACRGVGVDGIVEHGVTGLLVPVREVDAVADALRWSSEHTSESAAIGKRAQHLVYGEYTWKATTRALMKLYQRSVEAANRGQAGGTD